MAIDAAGRINGLRKSNQALHDQLEEADATAIGLQSQLETAQAESEELRQQLVDQQELQRQLAQALAKIEAAKTALL